MTDVTSFTAFVYGVCSSPELKSVRAACRAIGIHPSTYYRWKEMVDRGGLEMLRPRERRAPRTPNAISVLVSQRIIAFSLGHPGFGPARISPSFVGPLGRLLGIAGRRHRVLRRHGLGSTRPSSGFQFLLGRAPHLTPQSHGLLVWPCPRSDGQHLGCIALYLMSLLIDHRSEHADGAVSTSTVVDGLDPVDDRASCFPVCRPRAHVEQLALQRSEERFRESIVEAVSHTAHGLTYSGLLSQLSEALGAVLAPRSEWKITPLTRPRRLASAMRRASQTSSALMRGAMDQPITRRL